MDRRIPAIGKLCGITPGTRSFYVCILAGNTSSRGWLRSEEESRRNKTMTKKKKKRGEERKEKGKNRIKRCSGGKRGGGGVADERRGFPLAEIKGHRYNNVAPC